MGHLLGNGVRFGVAQRPAQGHGGRRRHRDHAVAAQRMPSLPMVAGLSANHLAALLFPPTLRRLYVARDHDPAGDVASATLTGRAQTAGIEALRLSPRLGDFNEDLRRLGLADLRAALRLQLAPEDVARFHDLEERRRDGTVRLAPERIENRIGSR